MLRLLLSLVVLMRRRLHVLSVRAARSGVLVMLHPPLKMGRLLKLRPPLAMRLLGRHMRRLQLPTGVLLRVCVLHAVHLGRHIVRVHGLMAAGWALLPL